ncbi:hypothetical protein BDFB_015069 [Asbolus verrucosus]|uniref:Uncharacterized protein n=1 Tax=Asbolus verrucosus TaxID=1661398 RepID=A0A482VD80_ASBVE|nr:hypothetical protein BDFB_015069 [Asbolus verrucosus]
MEMFDRIIGRNTAIPWPPRSCDLTLCDFFLWPYIKNSIYTTPVDNLEFETSHHQQDQRTKQHSLTFWKM